MRLFKQGRGQRYFWSRLTGMCMRVCPWGDRRMQRCFEAVCILSLHLHLHLHLRSTLADFHPINPHPPLPTPGVGGKNWQLRDAVVCDDGTIKWMKPKGSQVGVERLRDTELDERARSSIPLSVCRISALTLEAPCPPEVAASFGGSATKFYTISLSGTYLYSAPACMSCHRPTHRAVHMSISWTFPN